MTKEQRIVQVLRRSGDDPMTAEEIRPIVGFPSTDAANAAMARACRRGLLVRVRTGHYVAKEYAR